MKPPERLTAWWQGRRWRDDRGDTSIQMAIIFPFVLLATVAVIQASMWYYARQIALTAAREGLTAARAYQSSPADGAAQARNVLGRTAGDSLSGYSVSAGSDGQRVRVQVSGTALSMIPGVPGLQVTQSASGPVERWTVPGE
ncbi:TadE/TadG family type IV pilus assembly protein [Streptomyces scabiei]|uniref:TadE/TadG family type IV pilus assembly protein n=1 Tax=Streptomyces TaxID=1883 RepID=UPI000AB93B3C|nr:MULTISPECIES: TadE/TadG family type IV pilus assembly protein [Streptomyces]MDX2576810.1 TadE/TadG family type IV pilus assembly protein [Streptomyces scabiei]MDX3030671.1 TadE/TadG family type IV pilus assembly protein [Streptomyces scabiei]MDX3204817.1 TadE/TadG family type IV pilus assembly protein [Streptomyces scabiei]